MNELQSFFTFIMRTAGDADSATVVAVIIAGVFWFGEKLIKRGEKETPVKKHVVVRELVALIEQNLGNLTPLERIELFENLEIIIRSHRKRNGTEHHE